MHVCFVVTDTFAYWAGYVYASHNQQCTSSCKYEFGFGIL